MKKTTAALAVFGAIVFTYASAPAQATSNYEYKPHEYVTVGGGLAPNQRFSIAPTAAAISATKAFTSI